MKKNKVEGEKGKGKVKNMGKRKERLRKKIEKKEIKNQKTYLFPVFERYMGD